MSRTGNCYFRFSCTSLITCIVFTIMLYLCIFAVFLETQEIGNLDKMDLYNDMYNWIIEYSITICAFVVWIVICFISSGCMIMCDMHSHNGPITAITMLSILAAAIYISEIVFLSKAIPIRNNVMLFCEHNTKFTHTCYFYHVFFEPTFIILAITLSYTSFYILLVLVVELLKRYCYKN
jgi:hypothetical protein